MTESPLCEPLSPFRQPRFFNPTYQATRWRLQQPFFAVPRGTGGLTSYLRAAAKRGVDLYRGIDKETGAKPMFARSGIPGTVGTATCSLWRELADALAARDRTFTVWPFEGELEVGLSASPVVVGEIYPRAAYATALLDEPIERRSRLSIAKTIAGTRQAAINSLKEAEWIRSHEVVFDDLDGAAAGEDDFDACLTAALCCGVPSRIYPCTLLWIRLAWRAAFWAAEASTSRCVSISSKGNNLRVQRHVSQARRGRLSKVRRRSFAVQYPAA